MGAALCWMTGVLAGRRVIRGTWWALQVDLSHKPGTPEAGEAHAVHHHTAVDMAAEKLLADDLDASHWRVKEEILNWRERIQWKHAFGEGQPASRRCVQPSPCNGAHSCERI